MMNNERSSCVEVAGGESQVRCRGRQMEEKRAEDAQLPPAIEEIISLAWQQNSKHSLPAAAGEDPGK